MFIYILPQLSNWPDFIRSKYSFSLYPITYPEGENEVQWKKVFKPCATQRLFIPVSMSNGLLVFRDL